MPDQNKPGMGYGLFAPQKKFSGMLEGPNVDISEWQGDVQNSDGTVSTIKTISFNVDGIEIVVPTLTRTGRQMTESEAIEHYFSSGEHFGAFDSVKGATEYASSLSDMPRSKRKLLKQKGVY